MTVTGIVLLATSHVLFLWLIGLGLIPAGIHLLITYYLRFETGVLGLLALGAAAIMPYLWYSGALQPDETWQRAIPTGMVAGVSMVVLRYAFASRAVEKQLESPTPRFGGDAVFWPVAIVVAVWALVSSVFA